MTRDQQAESLSPGEHRRRAARFRALAAGATTRRTKEHLLETARQSDALAARLVKLASVPQDADEVEK